MVMDIEDAICHLAKSGFEKKDLRIMVKKKQLIRYPSSLQVRSLLMKMNDNLVRGFHALSAKASMAMNSWLLSTFEMSVRLRILRPEKTSYFLSVEVSNCFSFVQQSQV